MLEIDDADTPITLTTREALRVIDVFENPPARNERFKQLMDTYQKPSDGTDTIVTWSPR